MKKTFIFLLLLISSFNLFSQEYIKINFEHILKDNTLDKTEIYLSFNNDGYLDKYLSKRKVSNTTVTKEIIGTKKENSYQLDINIQNDFNMSPPNLKTSYLFKKTNYGWNKYLVKNNKLLKKVTIDSDTKKIIEESNDGSNSYIYEKSTNSINLYNNNFQLINGFYVKTNIDIESGEKIVFNKIDDNNFILTISFEGQKTIYKIEHNYTCKFLDQIELLSTLINWDVPIELMPFIVIPTSITYHATSYLTEGSTTYEPEHLQQKNGLPWASNNKNGIGDIISIKEFKNKKPSKIIIMNGYQDSNHPDYYENNSRVKKIKITNKDTKKSKVYEIKDIKEEQSFNISKLGSGNNYDIEILEVYNGKKYSDLCIQYMVLE